MPRLALCGNAFPVKSAEDAIAVMREGELPELRQRFALEASDIGLGLYLPASAASELKRSSRLLQRWLLGCRQSGWPVWTANAFPYGGFHEKSVKEKAFLPDWSSADRLEYTCQIADLLAELLPPGSSGSISTCPLGYGGNLLQNASVINHLAAAEAHLQRLQRELGVHVVLSLEPEPDGAFERVSTLCAWLEQHFPQSPFLGVCWDLCHGAVVQESPEEAVEALAQTGTRCGKVQISAALLLSSFADPKVAPLLTSLANDPWLHQCRGGLEDQPPEAWADLPDFLDSETLQAMAAGQAGEVGIHCHVPVHRDEYFPGLKGTNWRHGLAVALQAGIMDFELETYTLPVLPQVFLEQEGLVGTFQAELRACFLGLGLDMTRPLS